MTKETGDRPVLRNEGRQETGGGAATMAEVARVAALMPGKSASSVSTAGGLGMSESVMAPTVASVPCDGRP